MTTYWHPCETGQTLFDAFCAAYEPISDGYLIRVPSDPKHPYHVAWRAWQEHRDSCEKCKVTK